MTEIQNEKDLVLLQEENLRLKRGIEELSVLNEIAIDINSSLTIENILEKITQKCRKHLKVEQAAISLLDEGSKDKPFQTMVRGWDEVTGVIPLRLDTQLTGWMLLNKKPLLINDFERDDRFQKTTEDINLIQSLLSVPLLLKDKMIGIITVFNKTEESGFNIDDQRLLSIISSQSSQVIENARLFEREQEYLKVQQELQLAYEIQTNLLPDGAPEIEGFEIFGKSMPAKEVGGDYYDFIPLGKEDLTFCIGDISGKGMPAALLMSNLQAAVRGQSGESAGISQRVSRINSMMYRNTSPEKFSTFLLGMLDGKDHRITYVNAGHNYPYLFTEGKPPLMLAQGDMVLGFLESCLFTEHTISLEQGDILFLYSDGITEAINEAEEELGEKRMIDLVAENRGKSLEIIGEKIFELVKKHTGDLQQYDDMTLVMIRKL